MMNLNSWNKLPPDLQQVITNAMAHSEKVNAEIWAEDKAKSVQKLKEAKMEVIGPTHPSVLRCGIGRRAV